jgi:hypothetical protein
MSRPAISILATAAPSLMTPPHSRSGLRVAIGLVGQLAGAEPLTGLDDDHGVACGSLSRSGHGASYATSACRSPRRRGLREKQEQRIVDARPIVGVIIGAASEFDHDRALLIPDRLGS